MDCCSSAQHSTILQYATSHSAARAHLGARKALAGSGSKLGKIIVAGLSLMGALSLFFISTLYRPSSSQTSSESPIRFRPRCREEDTSGNDDMAFPRGPLARNHPAATVNYTGGVRQNKDSMETRAWCQQQINYFTTADPYGLSVPSLGFVSQYHQDWFMYSALFRDNPVGNGVFLDVAAAWPQALSNSFFFEEC